MKKEFGKWLMDIAKYMTTAVLLASTFSKMSGIITYSIIITATAITLFVGLKLASKKGKEEENGKY